MPVGWTLTDERSPMFTSPPEPVVDLVDMEAPLSADRGEAVAPADPSTEIAESVTVVAPTAGSEPVTDVGHDPVEGSPGPDVDAEVLTLWADQAAHAEDPDGPQSPLLARAFRAAHRH